MKSLIVFYIPEGSAPINKKGRKRMLKNFKIASPKEFNTILIEDPSIEVVHTEVFFNPYQ